MRAAEISDQLTTVLVTEEQIHAKLEALARQVESDYDGKELLLVGVLKGAVMVMADFARQLKREVTMDWMAVSSYGAGTKSSGVVQIRKDLDTDLTGKHVLIVEDILDTGYTTHFLLDRFRDAKPDSLELCTLLDKPARRNIPVPARYVGFTIDDQFVVGYGLDYEEKFRELPAVYVLEET